MTITPNQCRAARELLNWKQSDLQKKSKLGIETIGNFERGVGNQTIKTLATIKKAFEDVGIEFVNDGKKEGIIMINSNETK